MNAKKMTLVGLAGLAVGFINGFFGGGGGMLVVPLLTYGLKLPVKKVHATAIMIILPITLASAAVYLFGMEFDLFKTLYVAIGATFGGILGAFALNKAPNNVIRLLFAGLMLFAGLKMIF